MKILLAVNCINSCFCGTSSEYQGCLLLVELVLRQNIEKNIPAGRKSGYINHGMKRLKFLVMVKIIWNDLSTYNSMILVVVRVHYWWILGGGLATSISRGKDRWWAIPLGIVMVSLDVMMVVVIRRRKCNRVSHHIPAKTPGH